MGDLISIDGTTGEVFLGEVPVVDSPLVRYFEDGTVDESDDLGVAVDRTMKHADGVRRMSVRANANTVDDAGRDAGRRSRSAHRNSTCVDAIWTQS